MKTETWVWYTLDQDYPGVDQNDLNLPLSGICLKALEGDSIFYDEAEFKRLVRVYADQGLTFSVWSVPTGTTGNIQTEVDATLRVLGWMEQAGVAPRIQLDMERDSTKFFWKGTAAQAEQLVDGIRAGARLGTEIDLCIYQFNEPGGFAFLGPKVDRFVTMDYWNDFKTTPESRLGYSLGELQGYGKPIQFGLPGNAPAAEMTRALQWLDDRGLLDPAPMIWRRGTTSRETWDAIAAFQPASVVPEPVPPVVEPAPDLRGQLLEELRGIVAAADDDAMRAALRKERALAALATLGG